MACMGGRKAPVADRRLQILEAAFVVASREGLDRLTVRKVAAEAGLSSGLVFFHFATKELLLVALLDLLLERALVGEPGESVLAIGDPVERMLALARQELELVAERRPMLALFFDYWALGHYQPVIRERIKNALARYRAAFLPLVRAAAASATERGLSTDPEQLSATLVAIIEGSVVQEVVDPDAFEVDGVLRIIESLVRAAFVIAPREPPVTPARSRRSTRARGAR